MSIKTTALLGFSILLVTAAPAAAQEAVCPGAVMQTVTARPIYRPTAHLDPQLGAAKAFSSPDVAAEGLIREPGAVALRFEEGAVSFRPSAMVRREARSAGRGVDGWHRLSDVVVSDGRITGYAPYRDRGAKPVPFVLDLKSGEVRLGRFAGVCSVTATG